MNGVSRKQQQEDTPSAQEQVERKLEEARAFRPRVQKVHPQRERLRALAREREQAEQTVAGLLRFRRETKEMSVKAMARTAGVDVATWTAWESGKSLPTLAEVEDMAPRIFVTPYLQDKLIELRRSTAA